MSNIYSVSLLSSFFGNFCKLFDEWHACSSMGNNNYLALVDSCFFFLEFYSHELVNFLVFHLCNNFLILLLANFQICKLDIFGKPFCYILLILSPSPHRYPATSKMHDVGNFCCLGACHLTEPSQMCFFFYFRFFLLVSPLNLGLTKVRI